MYICTVQYKASIYYSKDTSPSILRINEDFLCVWVLSEQQLETASYSSTPYMFQSLDILKISLPSNRFWLYRGSLICLNSIWADLCCLLKTNKQKKQMRKTYNCKIVFFLDVTVAFPVQSEAMAGEYYYRLQNFDSVFNLSGHQHTRQTVNYRILFVCISTQFLFLLSRCMTEVFLWLVTFVSIFCVKPEILYLY